MQKSIALLFIAMCSLQAVAQQNTMVYTEFDSLKTGKLIFGDSTTMTTAPVPVWTKTEASVYVTTGNVGIGTNSPSSSLQVVGQALADSMRTTKIYFNDSTVLLPEIPENIDFDGDAIFIGQAGGGSTSKNNIAIGNGALSSGGGRNTIAIGTDAFKNLNVPGGLGAQRSIAIGWQSLSTTTSSGFTVAVGYSSLGSLQTGHRNTAIGSLSGLGVVTGNFNTFIGLASRASDTTNNSVVLGAQAGSMLSNTQTGSIFLGYQAGNNEASPSNKLYIENSNSSTPLIYGKFDTDQLGINTTAVGDYTLSVGGNTQTDTLHAEVIVIDTTYVPSGYSLAVNGDVIAEQVDVVLSSSWPDYVFDENYELLSLEETASFIDANHHLPGVKSEAEMEEEGKMDLAAMNLKLLEKVEELTLHLIQQNERVKKLEAQNEALNERLGAIEHE